MTDNSENSPIDIDNDCIECFQNYTASEVFIQGLAGLVDQQDVESMIRAQKQILQRFEKTNEMLSNCNTLSVSRLKVASQQFKTYKQILVDIRKDLDYSCKKINVLKSKLIIQYPESTAATSGKVKTMDLDENQIIGENVEMEKSEENKSVTTEPISVSDPTLEKQFDKKIEISDSNSSESGEADSQVESNSISTSDTA